VAGTVLEVNESLNASPEQVNDDPFGSGWLIRVQLNGDLGQGLLDEAGYKALSEGQSH
jgi:glycine cleavage system H protein